VLRPARRTAVLLSVSSAVAEEVQGAFAEKFGYSPTALEVVRRARSRATRRVVRTRVRVHACADPDDDTVLVCALTVRADSSVSGACHVLALQPFRCLPILCSVRVWIGSRRSPREEFAKLAGACGTLCVHDYLSFLPTAGHEA
jgi:hypothetical protein